MIQSKSFIPKKNRALANGTATVQLTGGTMPYSYLWDNEAVDSFLTGLDLGNYSVVITDANGCSATEALQIVQPAYLLPRPLRNFESFAGLA